MANIGERMYATNPCLDSKIMSIDGSVPSWAPTAGGKLNRKCISAVSDALSTAPFPVNPNCWPAQGPEIEPSKATRMDCAADVFVAAFATGSSESASRTPTPPHAAASGTRARSRAS